MNSVYGAVTGMQDAFLTADPQVTLFTKNTTYDDPNITQTYAIPFDTSDNRIATIPSRGDYIDDITLKMSLPGLVNTNDNYWIFNDPPQGYMNIYNTNRQVNSVARIAPSDFDINQVNYFSNITISKVGSGPDFSVIHNQSNVFSVAGNNTFGQLGTGNTSNVYSMIPIYIQITVPIVNIACGKSHSVILDASGTMWVSGDNSKGQLGTGTTVSTTTFIQALSSPLISNIACNDYSTWILSVDNNVSCTGMNISGELGGIFVSSSTFQNMNEVTFPIYSITCGPDFTFLTTASNVWASGNNDVGQLGVGNMSSSVHGFTQCNFQVYMNGYPPDRAYKIIIVDNVTASINGTNYTLETGTLEFIVNTITVTYHLNGDYFEMFNPRIRTVFSRTFTGSNTVDMSFINFGNVDGNGASIVGNEYSVTPIMTPLSGLDVLNFTLVSLNGGFFNQSGPLTIIDNNGFILVYNPTTDVFSNVTNNVSYTRTTTGPTNPSVLDILSFGNIDYTGTSIVGNQYDFINIFDDTHVTLNNDITLIETISGTLSFMYDETTTLTYEPEFDRFSNGFGTYFTRTITGDNPSVLDTLNFGNIDGQGTSIVYNIYNFYTNISKIKIVTGKKYACILDLQENYLWLSGTIALGTYPWYSNTPLYYGTPTNSFFQGNIILQESFTPLPAGIIKDIFGMVDSTLILTTFGAMILGPDYSFIYNSNTLANTVSNVFNMSTLLIIENKSIFGDLSNGILGNGLGGYYTDGDIMSIPKVVNNYIQFGLPYSNIYIVFDNIEVANYFGYNYKDLRQLPSGVYYTNVSRSAMTLRQSGFIQGFDQVITGQFKYPPWNSILVSASLYIGNQYIQTIPAEFMKFKHDIETTYNNRPVLDLLEGNGEDVVPTYRVYFIDMGLLSKIPIHAIQNQDVQIRLEYNTIPGIQLSLIVSYTKFKTIKNSDYTLCVRQVTENFPKGPCTKIYTSNTFTSLKFNGENMFNSDYSNVSALESFTNVPTVGNSVVFNGPVNLSRIRDIKVDAPNSNVYYETLNFLKVSGDIAGLLFS
jgi:hypothetical protein